MSNFSNDIKEKEERKAKRSLGQETLGKFFYDLAKIVFTALVIGSIMIIVTDVTRIEYYIVTAVGLIATYSLAFIGNKIIKS